MSLWWVGAVAPVALLAALSGYRFLMLLAAIYGIAVIALFFSMEVAR